MKEGRKERRKEERKVGRKQGRKEEKKEGKKEAGGNDIRKKGKRKDIESIERRKDDRIKEMIIAYTVSFYR